MKSWRPDFSSDLLYFITTSIHLHRKILIDHVCKQIILDILDCYRRNGRLKLYSYVIMPTHIHFIVRIPEPSSIPDFMRNFKSISANRIRRYKEALNFPSTKLSERVWEKGYVVKEIFSIPFLEQKVKYIHENPCKFPWYLSEFPENYPWSSASYYLTSKSGIIPIDDFRDYMLL